MDRDWFTQRTRAGDLARAIGLDHSQVSRILSGQRDLKLSEVEKWADALGEPVLEVIRHAYDWSRPFEGAPEIDAELLRLAINVTESGLSRSPDRDIHYAGIIAESYVFLERWRRRGRAVDERTLEQLEETIAARYPA